MLLVEVEVVEEVMVMVVFEFLGYHHQVWAIDDRQ